ncbi:hypothetical protein PPL_09718 [Heterostelium album PN500]|uniref:RanBP2-type domain-containing protein n=1 Tax=Heterostelium pallidum (strain ATCC 26659 / Pp 5 / PN500) TaxID=670386 RepID=D3BNL5_HETP5|nr:hypothetical protein PPL_09718 [Heterostelium album PN500]EFA76966.1 hypothetical protein PPL_09718 [Heterostelium album PN500]|eukprot:XP_020429097.1 hypothetical protein PPL_09718 [Heterostelium album PN500]
MAMYPQQLVPEVVSPSSNLSPAFGSAPTPVLAATSYTSYGTGIWSTIIHHVIWNINDHFSIWNNNHTNIWKSNTKERGDIIIFPGESSIEALKEGQWKCACFETVNEVNNKTCNICMVPNPTAAKTSLFENPTLTPSTPPVKKKDTSIVMTVPTKRKRVSTSRKKMILEAYENGDHDDEEDDQDDEEDQDEEDDYDDQDNDSYQDQQEEEDESEEEKDQPPSFIVEEPRAKVSFGSVDTPNTPPTVFGGALTASTSSVFGGSTSIFGSQTTLASNSTPSTSSVFGSSGSSVFGNNQPTPALHIKSRAD